MIELERKHSLPTRIFHWVNAVALGIMIWSGILIYWAHDVYEIRIFGRTILKFFPSWFYTNPLWQIDHRLAEGMAWHFSALWIFALNGLAYVIYTAASGEWKHLVPNLSTPRDALHVVLHDLGIRKEPLPRAKFNGAQRIAYTGVVMMGAGSILSGIAIYKPVQFDWLRSLLGGYEAARLIHFLLTLGYVAFFVIHISQVVKAGWNNFRAMIIGVEARPIEVPSVVVAPAAMREESNS
ncbi:MAG: cytochrome b/b6 domain-containing protein [Isosphaeraceae bacterium]|nr:cytochrome b/b6 domain-containing protein [Isosphaeraceae bacterium]